MEEVFDSDPAGRAASGARSVRLFRDTEDLNSVAVLLDFDTKDAATAFLERLRSQVWDKPEVIGQLLSASPTARILEEVAREGQAAGLVFEGNQTFQGKLLTISLGRRMGTRSRPREGPREQTWVLAQTN